MPVDCRPVRLDDPAEMAQLCAVGNAVESEGRPYAILRTAPTLTAYLGARNPDLDRDCLVAVEDGRVLGSVQVTRGMLDNLDKAQVDVAVAPEHRGRGVGSALYDAALPLLRGDGRTELISMAAVPSDWTDEHATLRFARKHGFRVSDRAGHYLLRLPVPGAVLAEVLAGAAPHHAGYTLEHHRGAIPAGRLPSYCRVANRFELDAPSGDLEFEEAAMTPQSWLRFEEELQQRGRVRHTTLALGPDGDVVGFTELVVPTDIEDHVMQWGTLVAREHWGRRLGLAMKAHNLARVQADHPDRTTVQTSTSDTNASMMAVNERLGFERVEAELQLVARLG